MRKEETLGSNRIEDVRWLCSISESELDLLISLKTLILRRAKLIGRESLADKFDLRTLRALSSVFMEVLKGEMTDRSSESSAYLDRSNLMKGCVDEAFDNMNLKELMALVGVDCKRRVSDLCGGEDLVPTRKRSTE